VADAVKPVISPGAPLAVAVKLKVITPLVKVLGLSRVMAVVVLSHCIVLGGTGKILGVGLTVTVTVCDGPSLQPTGLTGVIT